jgi:hypothetical protein
VRRIRLACVLGGTIALLTTATTSARANDPVAAEALFEQGRALRDQGRFAEACDLFLRSEELDEGVGTLINIGTCFEQKKQYASAWGAYREALSFALRRNDQRAVDARQKALAVEPRVSHLTLSISHVPPDVSVTRNGAKVDSAALNTAVPVDSGTQTVVVTAPKRKTWQGKLELREGEAGTLRVPALETVPDEAVPMATQAKVALGLEVGGAIVLATGLVFGALAISTWSSVDKTCPSGRCASKTDADRVDPDQKRASTFAAVSTVTSLLGAAALTTGITLQLTAPAKRLAITPTVDRTGCGFLATLPL